MTSCRRRVSAVLALALGGCAAEPGSLIPEAGGSHPADVAGLNTPELAEAFREYLLNTDNGLEVRRWVLRQESLSLASVLASYADGIVVDEFFQQRLKRNGFRFVRVESARLEALLRDLGGARVDSTQWHGQIFDWRSLQDRPVRHGGQAVTVSGKARRFDRGVFQLLIRCWTLLMEDGPYIHLEAMPHYQPPHATDLRRLIGDARSAGEYFSDLALDLQLEEGKAYVLFSEPPNVDSPEFDVFGAEISDSANRNRDAGLNEQRPTRRFGSRDVIGPDATTPKTLGEVLLATGPTPSWRELVVFIPKVSDAIYPPEPVQAPPATPGSVRP